MTHTHFVFVGLGNPGQKYEMTRHNMGFLVIRTFALKQGIALSEEKKMTAWVGKKEVPQGTVHLLLPTTFMNESGQAVRRYLDYYRLNSNDLIVVVDDADLPFGEMRLKEQGSSGGHRGLESVAGHLGMTQFARLRIGIGRGAVEQPLADYVLDPFNASELDQLGAILERGADVLSRLLVDKRADVMSFVNTYPKGMSLKS